MSSIVTISMQKCHIICEEYHAAWLSTAVHITLLLYITVRENCPAPTVSWQQQMNILTTAFEHGTTTASGAWAAWHGERTLQLHAILSLQLHTVGFSPQIPPAHQACFTAHKGVERKLLCMQSQGETARAGSQLEGAPPPAASAGVLPPTVLPPRHGTRRCSHISAPWHVSIPNPASAMR